MNKYLGSLGFLELDIGDNLMVVVIKSLHPDYWIIEYYLSILNSGLPKCTFTVTFQKEKINRSSFDK